MDGKDLSPKQQALITLVKKNKPSSWTTNHYFSTDHLVIEFRLRSIYPYIQGSLIATIKYDEANNRLLMHISNRNYETSQSYIRSFLKKFETPISEV